VFCTGTFTADPAVDADAPLAIAKDTPATPNAGAALFRMFRFEPFFAGTIRVLPYLIVVAVVLHAKALSQSHETSFSAQKLRSK
jgi:hypothetical protein